MVSAHDFEISNTIDQHIHVYLSNLGKMVYFVIEQAYIISYSITNES